MRDYSQVKLDYITFSYTLDELSQKYNIPLQSIKRQSTIYNWREERRKYKTKLDQDRISEIITSKSGERDLRIIAFKKIMHKLMNKLEKGLFEVKSKEGLINALKNISEHLELLEGNPTGRVELSESELKDRLNRVGERIKTLTPSSN